MDLFKRETFILFGSAAFGLVVMALWLGIGFTRFFEVSDEGFYLLVASDKERHGSFVSPFGSVTSRMFQLASGNIVAFRLLGVILFAGALAYLYVGAFKIISVSIPKLRAFGLVSLAILIALSGYYSSFGLYTPSYNWLSLIGLVLMVGSLLRVNSLSTTQLTLWLTALLWGTGVTLSLWGKPSSTLLFIAWAILLALLCSPRVLFSKLGLALVASSIILPLAFATASSSIDVELARFTGAYEAITLIDPNHGVFEALKLFVISSGKSVLLAGVLAIVAVLGLLILHKLGGVPLIVYRDKTTIFLMVALSTWVISVGVLQGGPYGVRGMSVLFWIFFIVAALPLAAKIRVTGIKNLASRQKILLLLLGLPLSHAFGSNNGFWQTSVSMGVLIGYAALWVGTSELGSSIALPFGPIMAFLLFIQASYSLANPYRSTSLVAETIPTEIRGTTLRLPKELGIELTELDRCANRNGWVPGSKLADFTRWSPGITFLLDADFPSTYMTNTAGYAGSMDFALSHFGPEKFFDAESITETWLLFPSPVAPDRISSQSLAQNALGSIGSSLPNFETVCKGSTWELMRHQR